VKIREEKASLICSKPENFMIFPDVQISLNKGDGQVFNELETEID